MKVKEHQLKTRPIKDGVWRGCISCWQKLGNEHAWTCNVDGPDAIGKLNEALAEAILNSWLFRMLIRFDKWLTCRWIYFSAWAKSKWEKS